MENSKQHFFRRPGCLIFGAIGIGITLFFLARYFLIYAPKHLPSDSSAELERIRTELPLAKARWESHNITEYEVDVGGIAHPRSCFDITNDLVESPPPWHLKIRQNAIVFDSDIQKKNVEECGISNFLPPKVFDSVRQWLQAADPKAEYLKIEFDPEYGFVSEYYLTSKSYLSDLYVHYTISNFRPQGP